MDNSNLCIKILCKKERMMGMLKGMRKGKYLLKKKLLVVGIVCVFGLSACETNKEVEVEAGKIVDAIENNNMKSIESIIFGTGDLAIDQEFAEIFNDSEQSEGNGIISKIIEQDSIKVEKVTEEHIVYKITTPELSDIFHDVMKEENMNVDTFEQYVYNYIATADKVKIQVEVPYTYEDGVFTADYSTQEFMNGITGNLITAYQDLVQQMIEENRGEGGK